MGRLSAPFAVLAVCCMPTPFRFACSEEPQRGPVIKGRWVVSYFVCLDDFENTERSRTALFSSGISPETTVMVDESKFEFSTGSTKTTYSYRIGKGQTGLSAIDLLVTDKMGKTITLPGVFQRTGERVDICIGLDGERPKNLEVRYDQLRLLLCMKRSK